MGLVDYSIAIGVIVAITIILLSIYLQLRRKRTISKPLCLQASDITCDSVSLKWIKPAQGGNLISSYTIYYRTSDDSKWQSKWTSTEESVKANGLNPMTCYSFKVRPECGRRHGEESDFIEKIETKPRYPGKPCTKPISSRVTKKSITLSWGEAEYGADLIKQHTILYRPTQNSSEDWKKLTVKGNSQSVVIDNLDSETEYSFKVSYVGDAGSGPESDLSDPIKTDTKVLSERIKQQSELVSTSGTFPNVYKLPMKYTGGQKYVFGEYPSKNIDEKVLLLIGAGGSGKTTLLNSIANYILGVRLEDGFRFKIDITDDGQANAYTFHPMNGSQLSYTLTIIDTPGFDNGGDDQRDKATVHQLYNLLSIQGEQGISCFNGVVVVAKSSSTLAQRHIFDSMLSVFGKNISSNMFLMITFADDHNKAPPVISTAKQAELPYNGKVYTFNNSTLFSKLDTANQNSTKQNWETGIASLQAFFDVFGKREAIGAQLTTNVLAEWQQLQITMQELQDCLVSGRKKFSEFNEAQIVLANQESEMERNRNYSYKVTRNKNETIDVSSGKVALNCHQCLVTCQYPCDFNEKSLDDSPCSNCPSKCPMRNHHLQGSRYKISKVEEIRTNEERKQKFLRAEEGAVQNINAIKRLKKELSDIQQDISAKIDCAREHNQRLDDIALKSSNLTETDHIDSMIQLEEIGESGSCSDRIAILKEKKATRLLVRLNGIPPKEFSKDWWASC